MEGQSLSNKPLIHVLDSDDDDQGQDGQKNNDAGGLDPGFVPSAKIVSKTTKVYPHIYPIRIIQK